MKALCRLIPEEIKCDGLCIQCYNTIYITKLIQGLSLALTKSSLFSAYTPEPYKLVHLKFVAEAVAGFVFNNEV